MKKLNITKKKFNESRYFQTKYGKLEYVSESGKLYKTTKGKVLKFNEGVEQPPVEESHNDIENDPAYTCPICGGHNCEFEDCEDPGVQEGYFDGSKFTATWWCADCQEAYAVTFKMNVVDVGEIG